MRKYKVHLVLAETKTEIVNLIYYLSQPSTTSIHFNIDFLNRNLRNFSTIHEF